MKRLLLLISLICAVPMVAGMSSRAHAGNQKASVDQIKGSKATGFLPSSNAKKKAVALKQGQPTDPTAPVPPTTPESPDPGAGSKEVVPGGVPTAPVTPALPAPGATPTPDATPSVPAPVPSGFSSGTGSDNDPQKLRQQLDGITRKEFDIKCPCFGSLSPGMTIFNPSAFGADNNTVFLSGSYQNRTRFTNTSDGELGLGIGLGDASSFLGAELSYTINSFGRSQGFGSGGFNAKIHKKLSDDFSLALGWNQFAQVKFGNGSTPAGTIPFDYPKNSYYAAATKVFATTDNIDSFLSRIALTAGVGGGTFLREEELQNALIAGRDPSGLGVFGSAGFRLAKPLSAVVEWTGQDLAAGLSYVPFEGFPLVISPSFRDITGAGNGARFVLGTGLAYTF
jgi:hypothetical protein